MKALILDYAIKREADIKPIYQYDFEKGLNVITIDDKKIPFIDSSSEDIALLTHTRVVRESNDENIDILELQTKTKIARERDDDNFLLELYSKTFVARERDDEGINYN
ncbi:MAG: hypothetical protein VB063_04880 [Bacteroides graminisolvens]|nr:hypothetical protein [Bacteroides graminisolvens]